MAHILIVLLLFFVCALVRAGVNDKPFRTDCGSLYDPYEGVNTTNYYRCGRYSPSSTARFPNPGPDKNLLPYSTVYNGTSTFSLIGEGVCTGADIHPASSYADILVGPQSAPDNPTNPALTRSSYDDNPFYFAFVAAMLRNGTRLSKDWLGQFTSSSDVLTAGQYWWLDASRSTSGGEEGWDIRGNFSIPFANTGNGFAYKELPPTDPAPCHNSLKWPDKAQNDITTRKTQITMTGRLTKTKAHVEFALRRINEVNSRGVMYYVFDGEHWNKSASLVTNGTILTTEGRLSHAARPAALKAIAFGALFGVALGLSALL